MTMNRENLGVTVTIDDEHSAEDMIPAIEAAGLVECKNLAIINVILGKVALAAELDRTIETIRQVPGVASAEPAITFNLYDADDTYL